MNCWIYNLKTQNLKLNNLSQLYSTFTQTWTQNNISITNRAVAKTINYKTKKVANTSKVMMNKLISWMLMAIWPPRIPSYR